MSSTWVGTFQVSFFAIWMEQQKEDSWWLLYVPSWASQVCIACMFDESHEWWQHASCCVHLLLNTYFQVCLEIYVNTLTWTFSCELLSIRVAQHTSCYSLFCWVLASNSKFKSTQFATFQLKTCLCLPSCFCLLAMLMQSWCKAAELQIGPSGGKSKGLSLAVKKLLVLFCSQRDRLIRPKLSLLFCSQRDSLIRPELSLLKTAWLKMQQPDGEPFWQHACVQNLQNCCDADGGISRQAQRACHHWKRSWGWLAENSIGSFKSLRKTTCLQTTKAAEM